MVSQNIVTFPKLLHTIWGISKQLQLGKDNHLDANFPPELQIIKAVRRIRDRIRDRSGDQNHDQKHLLSAAYHAILCDFMISKQSRSMQDNWIEDTVALLTLTSHWAARDTLPGEEGGNMLQDALRFLTSRAFLAPGPDVPRLSDHATDLVSQLELFAGDAGLNNASLASELFERNRRALFAQKYANPHRHGAILNQSQRTKFLESVQKLLAQPTDTQTHSSRRSIRDHFYIFDIVREYNSRPEVDANGVQVPEQPWVQHMRFAYDEYYKSKETEDSAEWGKLKQHFDRLKNSFPYADTASPEADILATALRVKGLTPQVASSHDETKLVPPQGTQTSGSQSSPRKPISQKGSGSPSSSNDKNV